MELQIRCRDFYLDPVVIDHISREVNRVRRRLPGISLARVELTRVKTCNQDYRVQGFVALHVDGTVISGAMNGADAVEAVNLAVDDITHRSFPSEWAA